MYGQSTAVGGAGVTGLALTGMNIGWVILLGLTLIVVGGAMMRLMPKEQA